MESPFIIIHYFPEDIMKKLLFLALTIAMAATGANASVRFGGGTHAGLSFGNFPEPLNQFYGMGYGFGLNGDVDIIPALALRLNLDYSRFGSDKDKLRGLFSVTDAQGNPLPFDATGLDASIFSGTANAIGRIPTGSAVRPYGIFGLGLYVLKASDLKVTSSGQTLLEQPVADAITRFGLNLGAGTEFLVGPTRLFVEAKYVMIFTDDSTTGNIPITVGVAF